MLFEFKYGSFANYSPRGTGAFSERSRNLRDKLKAGDPFTIDSIIPHLSGTGAQVLSEFLAPDVVFVPIPSSAPILSGAAWNSKLIAETLHKAGFGTGVYPILERKTAIRKSHLQSDANSRPLVSEHVDTLSISNEILPSKKIVLIDDFVTQGRTAAACALKIQEILPQAEISLFAIMRTQSTGEIGAIVAPSTGTIKCYPSGKTYREDAT